MVYFGNWNPSWLMLVALRVLLVRRLFRLLGALLCVALAVEVAKRLLW